MDQLVLVLCHTNNFGQNSPQKKQAGPWQRAHGRREERKREGRKRRAYLGVSAGGVEVFTTTSALMAPAEMPSDLALSVVPLGKKGAALFK